MPEGKWITRWTTLNPISHDAWRRNGEGLFHGGVVPSLWFRQFTHDLKLTILQNLSLLQDDRLKGQTGRLSS
jgi:hypothetical protein